MSIKRHSRLGVYTNRNLFFRMLAAASFKVMILHLVRCREVAGRFLLSTMSGLPR